MLNASMWYRTQEFTSIGTFDPLFVGNDKNSWLRQQFIVN